jgi:hypothetical protein
VFLEYAQSSGFVVDAHVSPRALIDVAVVDDGAENRRRVGRGARLGSSRRSLSAEAPGDDRTKRRADRRCKSRRRHGEGASRVARGGTMSSG